jgi:MFS family permease
MLVSLALLFTDDLPVWGFVGSVLKDDDRSDQDDDDSNDNLPVVTDDDDAADGASTRQFYLFKHLDFTILRNGNRIVKVNCTADPSKVVLLNSDLTDLTVEFSYSAHWHDTTWPYEKRMELYEDSFFAQELDIHWLSIMNSCVLVVLLTGFLALIVLRVLKSDYARYSRADEEEDEQEDYGWKLIHGDVFRFPTNKLIYTAYLGLGVQLTTVTACVLLLALVGIYYPSNGGAMYTSLIIIYALTSVIGGFTSGRYYAQMGGTNWSWNLVAQATLFTLPFVVVVLVANSVALYYNATASLPFTTMVIVLMVWLLVGVPLCVLGGIAGKNTAGQFNAPVRTKNFPREIPHIPIYRRWYTQMVMSGFLPFSAIYIELFYVFSSIWGHSSYQLFGILVIVFIILFVVVSCITVALTYFQLSMEDHRWWWSSFFCGGSVAFFIYAYSLFFFFFRSKMSGALQATFYFGYMLVICYFFFIVCGAIGAFSSLAFTRYVYSSLKID